MTADDEVMVALIGDIDSMRRDETKKHWFERNDAKAQNSR